MARARVKRLYVKLGFSNKLVISLRRFRTRPENRSKRFRQLVLPMNAPKYRELAIRVEGKKRRQRSGHKRQPVQARRLYNQGIISLAFLILGFTGIIYSGLNLRNPVTIKLVGSDKVSAAPVQEPPPVELPKTLPKSLPLRISIPKIQVDTAIVPVDLQPNGAVALPDGFDVAGWYDKSPTPGELGPSVILGHVDSYKGIAIFWRLRELAAGDKLIVNRADGSKATFNITGVKDFSQNSFPTQEVYGNIDYAGIRVITCSGTFSEATQHYDRNMVVYGTLE